MSTARYSPVVDDGLEVVPGTAPEHRPVEHSADNPPEVQERDDYPEAIPEQTDLKQDQNKGEGFFAPGVHDPSPPYSNSQYVQGGWSDPQAQKARRRVCGLPFWGFIALAVAVIVIVILAAVLGGVLGSKKSNSNTIINDGNNGGSSNSSSSGDTTKPYPAQAGSGISAVQLGGDGNQPITYVQDESNNIIENIWIPSNDSANTFSSSTKSTVATDAKKGSPIVAMSYLRNATSLVTRHIVYIDNNNHLKDAIADSSSNNQWSNGGLEATKTQTLGSSSVALAACCADFINSPGQGIRLYYGASGDNLLQEMGADTSNSTWNWQYYTNWNNIAGQSGVACETHDEILALYYINSTTGKLQQSWADWDPNDPEGWQVGPEYDQLNTNLASSTDIAVSNNGQNTEIITFQLQDGSIQEVTASLNHNNTQYESEINIASASMQSSKLGSLFVGNGTLLLYQDPDANVIASGWSTSMAPTFNKSVPYSA